MAAPTSVGASGRGGRRRPPARSQRGSGRGLPGGPRGGGAGVLQRLKLAVEAFVQAASDGGREGARAEGRPPPGGRKSRRARRREERRRSTARRLQGPGGGAGPGAGAAGGPRAEGRREERGRPCARRAPRPPPPRARAAPAPAPAPAQARGPRGGTSPAAAAAAAARTRALLAANEQEDREIRRLERRLGLNRRRRTADASAVPPGFARDGLDYILGALGSGRGRGVCDSSGEREEGAPRTAPDSGLETDPEDEGGRAEGAGEGREDDEEEEEDIEDEEEEEEEDEDEDEDEEEEDAAAQSEDDDEDEEEEMEEDEDQEEDEEDAGAQSEDDEEDIEEDEDQEEEEEEDEVQEEKRETREAEPTVREKREGKRVRFAEDEGRSKNSSEVVGAAPQSLCENGDRYIPPHVRRAEETVDAQKREERERLRKHVQGLINRLSEPNMASISGQLEELYMAHSRRDMNDTLTGVLMSACAPDVAVPSRLVMEHMLLVSVLHRTVGTEVGAHFLEAVVRRFDDVYRNGSEGKECANLFTIIAHLYNFHVVQSLLIFDVLKKLTGTFTEKDIELILLMLKNVGFSLRKDDALSLKELISETQAKANGAQAKFQDQTRVRFMLEIMLALKNNDMRKIPGYDPEPVEKLRKLQRALVHGAGSSPETQLRVSWDGILNATHTGRWWVVGSAWSGTPMIDGTQQKVPEKQLAGTVSAKVLELARKQRMNTSVRRNIFCTIMTSEDFLDAFEKLLKLGFKDQQEREIVHVLVDCCLQEKTYNPFYAFLAAKFCDYERRFQMTFQFSIWDKFRDLENLPATNFSNLVHLVAHLLKTKSLPLSILKVVEFSELDKPRVHFLRKVLYMLLMETEVEDLGLIFARVSDNPKLGVLREGLTLFIRHFLLKSTQAPGSAEEASVLRARADLTTKALQGRASLRM